MLDSDLLLVIGMVIAFFSVPSIMSALSENRAPRVAAVLLILGGSLAVYAISSKPGGYTVSEIPNVFVRVVGRYVN